MSNERRLLKVHVSTVRKGPDTGCVRLVFQAPEPFGPGSREVRVVFPDHAEQYLRDLERVWGSLERIDEP